MIEDQHGPTLEMVRLSEEPPLSAEAAGVGSVDAGSDGAAGGGRPALRASAAARRHLSALKVRRAVRRSGPRR